MSKVIIYDSILDYYPILEHEYLTKMKEFPCFFIRSYEGFLDDFSNKDDFIQKAFQELIVFKEQLFMKEMNIYLCIATRNLGETDKLQNYLKVWKKLKKYELNNFYLGYEQKAIMNNSLIYYGNAKLEFKDISKAMEILYDNKNNSFIYINSDNELLNADKTKELCEILLYENIKKMGYDLFDFSNLYSSMSFNNSIIRMASDGEEISMDIIQKISN